MKLFKCQACANVLYFENAMCERCGLHIGYSPELADMTAVEPDSPHWTARADPSRPYRFCENWERHACNWLVPADAGSPFCRACQHNRTIPDISDATRHQQWVKIETAKRRLFYSLLRLCLPLPLAGSGAAEPLVFEFLDDVPERKAMTGHDTGTITIALREADDAEREKLRTGMHEPYRTMLGHFRHEVGHFYWDRLVRDGNRLDSFRAVFGDERAGYGEALSRYYASGPKLDWQTAHVSAYATMHPWEDFAETWAHYLHIVDTLEMARAFGLTIAPRVAETDSMSTQVDLDPYRTSSIAELLEAWLPITFAVNSLNRTMGQPDLYPFVISPPAAEKLDYVRQLVAQSQV